MYKINDMNMNGQPSYVFKKWEAWPYPWGKNRAKILCKMNCVTLIKCIGHGWKTLNIMGFHPSSRKLLSLATVEVKGEASQHVILFWKDRPCFTEKEKSSTNRIHALK